MPKLRLAFLFKPDIISKHKISHICLLLEDQKIITGSFNGDLIIWSLQLDYKTIEPKIFMTPCINQSIGRVTCMTILNSPLQKITDGVENCLISVHCDNRIRIWDTKDGRCLNISSHNIFEGDENVLHLEALSAGECRYFACITQNGNLHILDIWKLKVVRTIKVSNANISAFKIEKEKKDLLLIDSLNNFIFWDLKDFFSNEINEYSKYISQSNKEARSTILLKDLSRKYLNLPGSNNEKPINFVYDKLMKLFIAVYESKILIYSKEDMLLGQIKSYMSVSFTNHSDLSNIYKMIHYESIFLMIITGSGNMLCLDYRDLLHLWNMQEKIKDDEISFSYTDFSFFKEKGSNVAFLTLRGLNLLFLVDHNLPLKFQKSNHNLTSFDHNTNILVIYSPNDHFIRFYNCGREVEKFKERIRLISQEDDSESKILISRNSVLNIIEKNVNLERESLYYMIPDSQVFEPFIVYLIKNKNTKEEPRLLRNLFSKVFTSHFSNEDLLIFEKDELITSSLLAFVKNKESCYIVGTNKGKVYLFPLFFESNIHKYKYFYYQMPGEKSMITLIYYIKSTLLISNIIGRFVTLDLQTDLLEDSSKNISHKNIIAIDLSPSIKTDQFLLNPIKRILQIKQINKEPKIEENNGVIFMDKANNSLFNSSLCLILENNIVAIFSLSSNTIDFILKGNEGSILGVFYHSAFDQLFVLTSIGETNIWSISTGDFERTIPYSQFKNIFDLKNLIEIHSKNYTPFHSYNLFKTLNKKAISSLHSVLEFNNRAEEVLLDYFEEAQDKKQSYQLNNERFGDLGKAILDEKTEMNLIWSLNYSKNLMFESKSLKSGTVAMKLRIDTKKLEKHSNSAHILLIDCKKNVEKIRQTVELEGNKENKSKLLINYLPLIFPFGVISELDQQIYDMTDYKLPVFDSNIGIQGLGESFSFIMKSYENWSTSNYLSSLQSLAIMFCFLNTPKKSNKIITGLILKTVEILTKKGHKINKNFKTMSISLLSRFCIDENNEILNSACNLIMASILTNKEEILKNIKFQFSLFSSNLKEISQSQSQYSNLLSRIEVIWIILTGYAYIYTETNPENLEIIFKRIISTIDLKNCLINPMLVAPCIKLFTDGLGIFKKYIVKINDFLSNLIFIYFHYSSVAESQELQRMNNNKSGILHMLPEFNQQSETTKKRMKQTLIKALQAIAVNYVPDFIGILKVEILNSNTHLTYPCTIIDIIRNLLKTDRVAFFPYLHILIEIILKSLDNTNLNLRRTCQKAATHALHTIVKLYPSVSFSQQNQLYATCTNDVKINIYDLRSASKSQTITSMESSGTSISFDSNGKLLAVYSYEESIIKIFNVGNSGFIGSIFGLGNNSVTSIPVHRGSFDCETLKNEFKIVLSWSENDKQLILKFGDSTQMNYDILR